MTAVVIFLSKYLSRAKDNKNSENTEISKEGIKVNKAKKVIYFLFALDPLTLTSILRDFRTSIKIIEWPQLIETNVTDKLEIHLSYASNENERKLILKGLGKWKAFNLDEL